VPTNKGTADVGRFVVDGESDRSVHDILASYASTAEAAEKTHAEDFLRTALAGGPRRTKDVEEEATQIHGIARRTLERARRTLRIPAAKRPTGQPRNKDGPAATKWWIALPEHEGDLADAGPGRQHASASQGRRCGGVAVRPRTRPPTAAARRTITTRRPAQTARPPARPPGRLADCITSQPVASAPMSASSATAASPRKPTGGPDGPAGADANPAA